MPEMTSVTKSVATKDKNGGSGQPAIVTIHIESSTSHLAEKGMQIKFTRSNNVNKPAKNAPPEEERVGTKAPLDPADTAGD